MYAVHHFAASPLMVLDTLHHGGYVEYHPRTEVRLKTEPNSKNIRPALCAGLVGPKPCAGC